MCLNIGTPPLSTFVCCCFPPSSPHTPHRLAEPRVYRCSNNILLESLRWTFSLWPSANRRTCLITSTLPQTRPPKLLRQLEKMRADRIDHLSKKTTPPVSILFGDAELLPPSSLMLSFQTQTLKAGPSPAVSRRNCCCEHPAAACCVAAFQFICCSRLSAQPVEMWQCDCRACAASNIVQVWLHSEKWRNPRWKAKEQRCDGCNLRTTQSSSWSIFDVS